MADDLKHYGIIGMRWGQRKSALKRLATRAGQKIAGVKARLNGPDTSSESHTKSRQLMKKKLSELSDEEIRTLSQRIRLEKEYKELTKRNTTAAEKMVGEAIKNSLKATLESYLQKYVSEGSRKLVEYIINRTSTQEE